MLAGIAGRHLLRNASMRRGGTRGSIPRARAVVGGYAHSKQIGRNSFWRSLSDAWFRFGRFRVPGVVRREARDGVHAFELVKKFSMDASCPLVRAKARGPGLGAVRSGMDFRCGDCGLPPSRPQEYRPLGTGSPASGRVKKLALREGRRGLSHLLLVRKKAG